MVGFTGFHENMVTFHCDDTVKVGIPVTVNGKAAVTKSTAGMSFCGIARSVRENCASVQLSGYMRLPYSGTAPAYGVTSITADGNGGIKSGVGCSVLVVEIDTEAKECGFIL